jgi:hypothetical protein
MKIFSKLPNGDYIETDPSVFFDMSAKELLVWLLCIIIGVVLVASPYLLMLLLAKLSGY